MNIQDIYLGDKRVTEIFQDSLGLTEDYVQHILQEDDWTMMIVSWALVEALLNQAISARLGQESLDKFIEHLNIGGRTGKAEMAYCLGLINKEQRKFIDVFSEVRNRFAHGIRRFKTTFDEYFAGIDDSSKYENALSWKHLPGSDASAPMTFSEDKRTLILINVVAVCVSLANRREIGERPKPSDKGVAHSTDRQQLRPRKQ